MKRKIYILSAVVAVIFSKAQNADLSRISAQKQINNTEFEKYWSKLKKKDETKKEELKSRVDFFFGGQPFFLQPNDTDQITNSNADILQKGQVSGLAKSFNGSGQKVFVFDGGRVFANHTDFGGTAAVPSTQITNMEDPAVAYSDHSTSVTSMLISKGVGLQGTIGGVVVKGNTKGVVPQASVVSYTFGTTTLPGETSTSTVYQKIQKAAPNISNHSYGINSGWDYEEASDDNAGEGWYWHGYYDPDSNESYDLQGTYYSNDANYDALVRNNPAMIIVKSSGNYFNMGPTGNTGKAFYYDSDSDGYVEFPSTATLPANNCANGFDCIGSGSLAKNLISVGASEKITANSGRYTTASDVVKAGYSSVGARDDGAIKPDITAVGSGVFSASYNSDTKAQSYSYGSGTSFAAPNITGVITLWNEIYKSLFSNAALDAAKAKTLLVHSASEAGAAPGPDAWYGWGFVNAKKGAELLVGKSNGTVLFDELPLANGATYTKDITTTTSGPLKVTISWVDLPFTSLPKTWNDAYNNRTSKLINDLDLRIVDTNDNTVYLPWKLDVNNLSSGAKKGDNTVDNVEQVVIDNAAANRTYRIKITHKGTLSGGASQNFAILAEGTNNLILSAQETKKNDVSVTPSITKDFVSIITNSDKVVDVEAYDFSGKRVADFGATEKINVSPFANGVYILKIKTKSGDIITKKIIKE